MRQQRITISLPRSPLHPAPIVTTAGKYCQVLLVSSKQQIICNLTSAAKATPLDFTGSGFSLQGMGFANDGGPLYLTPGGTQARVVPGGRQALAGACCLYASYSTRTAQ